MVLNLFSYKRFRLARGYTLVEMLIVMAILGVVLTMGARGVVLLTRSIQITMVQMEINRDAVTTFNLFKETLSRAVKESVVISQKPGEYPHSSIVFQVKNEDDSLVTIEFYKKGRKLFQTIDERPRKITSNLRFLSFNYPRSDKDGAISFWMTLKKKTFGKNSKTIQLKTEKLLFSS